MKFRIFISVLIAIGMMMVGCGKPNMRHSMIMPETGKIQAWSVMLVQDTVNTVETESVDMIESEFRSQYAQYEYRQEYVDEFADELRGMGFHIVEGDIAEGYIIIDISGGRWSEIVITEDPVMSEKSFRERHGQFDPAERESIREYDARPILIESDEVRGVLIDLVDMEGDYLGSVKIAGDKIEPEEAAKILSRLVSEVKQTEI